MIYYLLIGLVISILDYTLTSKDEFNLKYSLLLGLFWPVMVFAVTVIVICAILDNRDIIMKKVDKDESEANDASSSSDE